MHLQTLYSTSDYIEQNCHVLSTHKIEGNLKILGINKKSMKKLLAFTSYLVHFGIFIAAL